MSVSNIINTYFVIYNIFLHNYIDFFLIFYPMYDMLQHTCVYIFTLKYNLQLYDVLTETVSFLFNCDAFVNHSDLLSAENVNSARVRPDA